MVDSGKWRKNRMKKGMTISTQRRIEDVQKGENRTKRRRLIRLPVENSGVLLQEATEGINRMKMMLRPYEEKEEAKVPDKEVNESLEQVSTAVRKLRRMIRVKLEE